VYGNPYGIYVHHAASATIEHNSISNNFGPGGDGVVVDDSDTVTVRDNLIYGNGQAGIAVRQGSLTAVVDANTLYANSGDQVTVDPNGNSVSLTNNVIVLGPQNGITLFVGSALTTSHNDVWGQGGSDWNGASASGSDLSLDPRFVDPDGADGLLGGAEGADDDFHLDFAFPSPVLDAGSGAASAVTTADGLSLADRTSRTDGVLDGSSPRRRDAEPRVPLPGPRRRAARAGPRRRPDHLRRGHDAPAAAPALRRGRCLVDGRDLGPLDGRHDPLGRREDLAPLERRGDRRHASPARPRAAASTSCAGRARRGRARCARSRSRPARSTRRASTSSSRRSRATS
jgi:hypothetical protein